MNEVPKWPQLPIKALIYYEIAGSGWAKYISNNRLQDWAAKYFTWKTKRKYRRYQYAININRALDQLGIKSPHP